MIVGKPLRVATPPKDGTAIWLIYSRGIAGEVTVLIDEGTG
jgi:hypothetical protein